MAKETGPLTVTLVAVDSAGNESTPCEVVLEVIDNVPPSVSCSVGTPVIWTPSHDLICVGFRAIVLDLGTPGLEPEMGTYSNQDDLDSSVAGKPQQQNQHAPDAKFSNGQLTLRAERYDKGAGRVYLIVAKATDASNRTGVCASTVLVSGSQKQAELDALFLEASTALAISLANGGAKPPG